jgi:hypothetical protein
MGDEGGDDMAEATTAQMEGPDRSATVANGPGIAGRFLAFYTAVVVIQGVHVAEHIIQLIQVFVLGVPDDQALGLLGYVFAFQGTEEWLHIVFNVLYLTSLVVIAWGLLRSPPARSVIPWLAILAFVFFGVWLEGWHVVEHVVIISNVVANNGCPCPGILDARLGVSDTVLHFGYNAIAYSATVLPFAYLLRHRRQSAKPH